LNETVFVDNEPMDDLTSHATSDREDNILQLQQIIAEKDVVITRKDKKIEDLQNMVTKLKLILADKVLDGSLHPVSPSPTPSLSVPSYASVCKSPSPSAILPPSTIFPVLLQTNKQGRLNRNDVSEILQKIEKTIPASDLSFSLTKAVPSKDGSVVIHLPSSGDKSNAIQQINSYSEALGISASNIPKRFPRLIIKNLPKDVEKESVVTEIVNRIKELRDFPSIENETIRPIISLNYKNSNTSSVVIETSPNIRKILLNKGKVPIGLTLYRVEDHVRVVQCFKCYKFGHKQNDCRSSSQICGLCSGNHVTSSCSNYGPAGRTSTSKKCINCLHSTSHDVKISASNHGAIETKVCPSYKKQVYNLRTYIDYDS